MLYSQASFQAVEKSIFIEVHRSCALRMKQDVTKRAAIRWKESNRVETRTNLLLLKVSRDHSDVILTYSNII